MQKKLKSLSPINTKSIALAVMILGATQTSCTTNKDEKKVVQTETTENKMATINLTKADFLTKVANYEENPDQWKYLGDKPAIIDFYADWCGPCKVIAPILEEIANEYKDEIYVYKVNVDSETELASLFGIRSIPSLFFIPSEGQPEMSAGLMQKQQLKEAIDKVLLKK